MGQGIQLALFARVYSGFVLLTPKADKARQNLLQRPVILAADVCCVAGFTPILSYTHNNNSKKYQLLNEF